MLKDYSYTECSQRVPWIHIATKTWDTQERTKNRLVLVDLEVIGRLSSVITVPE